MGFQGTGGDTVSQIVLRSNTLDPGPGGEGFGMLGEARLMSTGMDPAAPASDPTKPDIQPLASPTTLNTAYQDVMNMPV